jgi:hypothetical protein
VPGSVAYPVGQRRSVRRDTLPGVDLSLAVQRQVVGIFRHQDLSDRGFRWHAAFDQSRGRRSLHDNIFATPVGVFRTGGDEHSELGRHDVQPLALVLADPVQLALAARAGPVVDIDDDFDPRQMRRLAMEKGKPMLQLYSLTSEMSFLAAIYI